jgi:MazG family protein
MSDTANDAGQRFLTLVETMRRLRAPGGCPWDRKQDFDSLKRYLLEECYEVMDSIDKREWPELKEELGDLMLQPVFLAQVASEAGLFTISESLAAINEKLVRRHPHIFGHGRADTAEEVKKRWDEIKSQEKAEKGLESGSRSILDDVLRSLPALVEAFKISKKAAAAGFEWPEIGGVVEKIQEEAAELAQVREALSPEEIEHEMGDMLFTLVNLARFLSVDPEQALRKANSRFRERFAYIEKQLSAGGLSLEDAGLDRLEELWQEGKRKAAK